MSAPPALAVIIVSWNVRELLAECLASLLAEPLFTAGAMEIVVVDNASSDGTVEMLRAAFPAVEVIASAENLGFGRANTLAFERTVAPIVLLLNPDTLIADQAVDRFYRHLLAHPDIAIAGCRLRNGDGSFQRWTGGRLPTLASVAAHYFAPASLVARLGSDNTVYLARDVPGDIEVGWVCGACLMLRRDRMSAPLFDPAYWMYGEDMDLCARVRAAGGRVVYTPVATVTHYGGASMRQQSGDVTLSSLRGLRLFYSRRSGPLRTRLLDAITVAGFAVRWLIYRAAGRLRGDVSLIERATSSARNARNAVRLMRA